MKRLILFYWLFPFWLSAQQATELTEEKQGILNYYQQNPIDINEASEAELLAMGILHSNQIESFVNHRKQIVRFVSLFELQTIPNWDLNTLRTIQALLVCRTIPPHWYEAENSKHQIILRVERTLEQKTGFSSPTSRSKVRYVGNPLSTLFRYRGTWNSQIRTGLLMSKDAGE